MGLRSRGRAGEDTGAHHPSTTRWSRRGWPICRAPDVGRILGTGGEHGFRFAALATFGPKRPSAASAIEGAAHHPEAPWRRVRKGTARRLAFARGRRPAPPPREHAAAAGAGVDDTALIAGALRVARPGRSKRGQYQTFDDAQGRLEVGREARGVAAAPTAERPQRRRRRSGAARCSTSAATRASSAARRCVRARAGSSAIDQQQELPRAGEGSASPRLGFVRGSWWELPDEKFDVILFLSAIHYEPDQRGAARGSPSDLTPTGVLVARVRRGPEARGKTWQAVKRADDIRRYPTFPMLLERAPETLRRPAGGAERDAGRRPGAAGTFSIARFTESMALIVAGQRAQRQVDARAFDLEEREHAIGAHRPAARRPS